MLKARDTLLPQVSTIVGNDSWPEKGKERLADMDGQHNTSQNHISLHFCAGFLPVKGCFQPKGISKMSIENALISYLSFSLPEDRVWRVVSARRITSIFLHFSIARRVIHSVPDLYSIHPNPVLYFIAP